MRPLRVGLTVAGVHLALALVGGILTVGAAFGAYRPWADTAGERLVVALTVLLLAPLSLLNIFLPRDLAPGYPVAGVVATSVLWGAAAAGIARWRRHRREGAARPAT